MEGVFASCGRMIRLSITTWLIIEIENLIQSERVELSMAGLEIKPRTPAILDRCAIQTDN